MRQGVRLSPQKQLADQEAAAGAGSGVLRGMKTAALLLTV